MRKAWTLALLLTIMGCDDPNPILGHWEVDATRSAPGTADRLELSGSSNLEFLEGRMLAGSSSLDVSYAIEEGRVTVTTLQGRGTVYEFESDDRMTVQSPLGAIVFRRVE